LRPQRLSGSRIYYQLIRRKRVIRVVRVIRVIRVVRVIRVIRVVMLGL
jgi:hypothetical protein